MRVLTKTLPLILATCSAVVAQAGSPTRDEVMRAVREGADYAVNVLLDEHGKSRCDYSIMDGKWYDYEPAWHTGQIINALVEVYKLTGDVRYLTAARKAGDWWVSLLISDHPTLKGMVRAIHGDGINFIVCATVTDGTPGLFNLYRTTKEKKYADAATSAGAWMLKNLYVPEEGVLYDRIDPSTGEVVKEDSPTAAPAGKGPRNGTVRVNNEGFLYKDMFEYTGNPLYRDVFVHLCDSLVAKQGPEGLWMQYSPNDAVKGSFHPRFNLWYAESLIEGYDLTGDAKYLQAAAKTLQFYTKYQKPDGTIYYENYLNGRSNENSVTGSTVAMAGLMWLKLDQRGVGAAFRDNIERSARWVVRNRFSIDHPDRNLAGATLNLRTRTKDGRLYLTQRDLGTSFALRFLTAYHGYKFGQQPTHRH